MDQFPSLQTQRRQHDRLLYVTSRGPVTHHQIFPLVSHGLSLPHLPRYIHRRTKTTYLSVGVRYQNRQGSRYLHPHDF